MKIYFLIPLNLLIGVEDEYLFPLFYGFCLLLKFVCLRCVQTGSLCLFCLFFK